jgi:hypothetical protein
MSDFDSNIDHGTAGQRVMRGIAWLDEFGAEHGLDLDLVDLASLDMRAPHGCVLGQAAGGGRGYWDVLRGMSGPDEYYGEAAETWATRHGFTRSDQDRVYWLSPSWEDLDAAWIAMIDTRRGNPGRVRDDEDE